MEIEREREERGEREREGSFNTPPILFKMRELRGAGVVTVNHTPGVANPADLFTKILSRQVFEKHRKFVLNLPAGAAADGRRVVWHASSSRDTTGAP